MATLEEASRCPSCKETGEQYAVRPSGNPGNKVLMFRCKNSTCKFGSDPEDIGWIVELDREGNIPERKAGEKQFGLILPKGSAAEERAKKIAESYSRPVENLDETPEVSGP